MKKLKLMALFLSATLAFSAIIPVPVFAADKTETGETEETENTPVPYILRTEVAGEYVNNQANVWLELNKKNSENIAAYQINLRLTCDDGQMLEGYKLDLEFDEALKDARIKDAEFDGATGVIKIMVAATKNLVKIDGDSHKLPIGKITLVRPDDETILQRQFKITVDGNTGNFVTVGTDNKRTAASEKYGEDFQIVSDGTMLGEKITYPLTVKASNGGTVRIVTSDENGNEVEVKDLTKIERGTTLKVIQTANTGYRFAGIEAVDTSTNTPMTISGSFTFTMMNPVDLTVTFEEMNEKFNVTVDNGDGEAIVSEYSNREVASVTAGNVEGKKFSHWINTETEAIVSYDKTYKFIVLNNISLKAVFVENTETIEKEPFVTMDSNVTTQAVGEKYRISFSGQFYLPNDCTLKEYGMVLTSNEITNAEEITKDNPEIKKQIVIATNKNSVNQFVMNINGVKPGATRNGRMYVIYTKDGVDVIKYSDTFAHIKLPTN